MQRAAPVEVHRLPARATIFMSSTCSDKPDWTNGRGKACSDYATWCAGGKLNAGAEWAGGEVFNYPERACCVCGGGEREVKPAFDGKTAHGYEMHNTTACRGADREVKKPGFAFCEEHCALRKCACAQFGGGSCRFTYTYTGLLRQTPGFTAFVRPGSDSTPAFLKLQAAEALSVEKQPCGKPPPPRPSPAFYLYDGPAFDWGERLAACFLAKNGRTPWAMPRNGSMAELGPSPHADLSHALWLHTALASHKRRVSEGDSAGLFIVPGFGSLSEATGSCEGTSHLERMAAAATALKGSRWFATSPKRHAIFAAAMGEDIKPLGELGEVLSAAGGVAMCTSRTRCSVRWAKKAELPYLPLLSLASPQLPLKLGLEACKGGDAKRRKTSVFFRGAHGTELLAQTLRSRVWELRELPGADIKFSRGGPAHLEPAVRSWLVKHGWSGVDFRNEYNPGTYTHAILRSDFCVIPRGDAPNPGRRLIDAIAAGCVPIFIGEDLRPPLASLLRYDDFSLRIPEADFLRYPAQTTKEAIEKALPRLNTLRRALLHARDEVLLSSADSPLANISHHRGVELVLLSLGKVICPRTPSSMRMC